MMIKKLFPYSLIFILILTITFSGCGGENNSESPQISFSIAESLAPGATSFPTELNDSGSCATINYPFYIAKYEVTYRLWSTIYTWATANARGTNKYTFANPGNRGGGYNKLLSINIMP